MKKFFNYSLLMFLFSFIAFACSKEDGDVGPSASLTSNFTTSDVNIGGGYNLSCITQSGSQWSFDIRAGSRHGLSNLQLELLACPAPGTTLELSEGSIVSANIVIEGVPYPLTPLYSDGSCRDIKGDDFQSFVKFEFENGLDDLVKKFGGTLSFTLADGSIVLYGANVIVKTGGKDDKCYRGTIYNCNGCDPVYPPNNCSFSQGRFFNPGNDSKHWPEDVFSVTVGNKTVYRGEMTLPGKNAADRAFFQAATLILSGTDLTKLPTDVKAAFDCIVQYYTDGTLTEGCTLQQAAGTIGDWIDKNHC